MTDLDRLRTFLAVLEHRSFSRAAEALRVTQSTVSFHVKALEAQTGGRLLDRTGGRVRPTATGRVLERYARRIVALGDEALARVRAEERGTEGHVRVAASTIPAEYLMPRALVRFRERHPNVAVTIEVSDSRRAAAAVLAEECDFAVVGARVRDKRLVETAFADDEIVLVGPSPNPWAPRGRLALEELAGVPLLLREEGSGTHEAVAAILAKAPPLAPIRTGSTEAVKRCAAAGLGLAFLSRLAVADDLRGGRLAVIALPGTPVRRRFYTLRLRSATPPAAAQSLMSMLRI